MSPNTSLSIIPEWILEYQQHIDSYISSEFHDEASELDKLAMQEIRGGRRIRAVLTLLWCEAFHGDLHTAIPIAVAYEVAHRAALILDDIIDSSSTRDGAKSLVAKYGIPRAILASNALLFSVPRMIAEYGKKVSNAETCSKLLELLGERCHEATAGEFLDLELGKMENVKEEDYLRMIRLKTGALVAASCASGALVGAGPDKEDAIATALGYGEAIGMAYQIQDDVMDFLGDENFLGKPAFTDIRSGKTSLVLIHLLKHCSEDERRFVHSLIETGLIENVDSERLLSLLIKYGSADYAKRAAIAYAEEAKSFLNQLEASQARNRIMELSEFLVHRII